MTAPVTTQAGTAGPRTARRAALDLLLAVEVDGAYANLTLPRLLAGLPPREVAFATELGYGALRAQGSLDHLLDLVASRPVAGLDPEVRAALRLGAYQLLETRTAPHAAVSETVGLVPPRARGFANAVLRRVAERCARPDPLATAGLPERDALALRTAHPRWIVDAFAAALPPAELADALAADSARPQVHLAVLAGDRDRFAGRPGALSPLAVVTDGGAPRTGPGVRVMDEGSQVCALALDAVLPPGSTVVDLAAGPGGKAALLASRGHHVVGAELHPHRARLVDVPVVVADSRRPPFAPAGARGPSGQIDAVLLDAPCSGLGALRRRPESRWRRQPADLPGLVALQRQLLAAAAPLVRPGGMLAYVVCSPVLAEAAPPVPAGFRVLDAAFDGARGIDRPERLQLWPHRHGTDAMSLLLLRREESA